MFAVLMLRKVSESLCFILRVVAENNKMNSESVDIFKLKAINFDNEKEVNSLLGLMRHNEQKALSFRRMVSGLLELESTTEDVFSSLISIAIFYQNEPVAHVGVVPRKDGENASIIFSAFDEKYLAIQPKLNCLLWKKISCLASRQGWSKLGFADSKAEHVNRSLSVEQFCEKETQILPVRTLQESIETVVQTEEQLSNHLGSIQFSEELNSL